MTKIQQFTQFDLSKWKTIFVKQTICLYFTKRISECHCILENIFTLHSFTLHSIHFEDAFVQSDLQYYTVKLYASQQTTKTVFSATVLRVK